MTFVGVEFASDYIEASIALVHRSWLTPRKKEVWWPPYKTGAQFKKALLLEEKPKSETWKLYGIKQIFFSCGMYYTCVYKHVYVYICVCVLMSIEYLLLI